MTSNDTSTPKSLTSVGSSIPVQTQTQSQAQHLHDNQPNPNSNPIPTSDAQSLHTALFLKQKRLLAARGGHVNIAIGPLEKQIRTLKGLLEELERGGDGDVSRVMGVSGGEGRDKGVGSETGVVKVVDESVDAGTEWVVVVPVQQSKAEKEDEWEKRSGESGGMVKGQGDVRMHAGERDLDHEKHLGTWI